MGLSLHSSPFFRMPRTPQPLPLRVLSSVAIVLFELCSATSSSFKAPSLLHCCYFFELCSATSSSFKAPLLLFLRALLREELALFNDHSIDDHQFLSISYEGAAPATQVDLWVHDPAIGALALDWDLSPDSHHLSRWYTESSRELFNHGKSTFISGDALLLRSSLHKKNNDSERFLLLGDRIINGDAKWGNTTPQFGEISFIDGYWEWLEDVLARNKDMLTSAKIYDVVFASLFTYVRNTNLIRSFCELWCPSTNSLHIPIGKVSISLWDLRQTGGLSIDGIFYDEVVPSARELTGVDKKDVPLLPPKDPRYKQPPARVQKKRLGEPRTSNNPTGFIGEKKLRSKDTEKVFDDLGVEKDVKEETNLAALLSCWLCIFVLPNKEVDQIRPGVFKVASMMAQGKRFSLAVPVLASIYHGLREITSSPNPCKCGAAFPIHYVYGWLGRYYDSYFLSAPTKFECGARMSITPSTLSLLPLGKPQQGIVTDHGKHSDSWNDYVISLRSSYLTLRRSNEHIVEPYSPHRFARQFRFCQDIPGKLREELSTGTLEAIYQLWESCTRLNTRADFMIPSHSSEGLSTKEYVEWWDKSLSNFCGNKLACEKPKSLLAASKGKNIITFRTTKSKFASEVTPPSSKSKEKEVTKAVTKESKKAAVVNPKTPLSIPASKPKPIVSKASEPVGENKKRTNIVLSEGSSSDKGECHCKRSKKKAADFDSRLKEKVTISDLAKLDYNLDGILDDLPDTSNHVELENQFASDEREGSVDGPDPFDLALRSKHNFVSGAIPPSIYFQAFYFQASYVRLCGAVDCYCISYGEYDQSWSSFGREDNTTKYVSIRSNFASGMTSEVKERRLADVDTKKGQLMEELDQLDLEAKKLKESLEGIDAQKAQKQHGVSTLQEEQAIIEATEVMEPADMEVTNNLEQLLKSELEEIQNLAWLD
ncbi:hypothetical protein RHSIM_Rhsim01G0078000 [Rhododendron simsii]|uniref:Aminotransferase-like plant mobile domain-containing protein n=1 Tax=Rhododendron simsii TaxID=118357 RepID=A0A834M0J7_RHOSS|nr:hypothetical protein RHSIM_Rhsim01G0078000 [Rhododendron simsii]